MTAPALRQVRRKALTSTAARSVATCGRGHAQRTHLGCLGRALNVALRDGHGIGIEEQIRRHVRLGNVAEVGPQAGQGRARNGPADDGHGSVGNGRTCTGRADTHEERTSHRGLSSVGASARSPADDTLGVGIQLQVLLLSKKKLSIFSRVPSMEE